MVVPWRTGCNQKRRESGGVSGLSQWSSRQMIWISKESQALFCLWLGSRACEKEKERMRWVFTWSAGRIVKTEENAGLLLSRKD